VARGLSAAESGKPAGWFFHDVPRDRLKAFESELEGLVRSIVSRGSRVTLVTHAVGFQGVDSSEERDALTAWRALVLRPTGAVLLDFEAAARDQTVRTAGRLGVGLVDAAAVMNGRREWFAGDLLHFNEEGAGVLADLVAASLETSLSAGAQ
jgi:hypothetical protein